MEFMVTIGKCSPLPVSVQVGVENIPFPRSLCTDCAAAGRLENWTGVRQTYTVGFCVLDAFMYQGHLRLLTLVTRCFQRQKLKNQSSQGEVSSMTTPDETY